MRKLRIKNWSGWEDMRKRKKLGLIEIEGGNGLENGWMLKDWIERKVKRKWKGRRKKMRCNE